MTNNNTGLEEIPLSELIRQFSEATSNRSQSLKERNETQHSLKVAKVKSFIEEHVINRFNDCNDDHNEENFSNLQETINQLNASSLTEFLRLQETINQLNASSLTEVLRLQGIINELNASSSSAGSYAVNLSLRLNELIKDLRLLTLTSIEQGAIVDYVKGVVERVEPAIEVLEVLMKKYSITYQMVVQLDNSSQMPFNGEEYTLVSTKSLDLTNNFEYQYKDVKFTRKGENENLEEITIKLASSKEDGKKIQSCPKNYFPVYYKETNDDGALELGIEFCLEDSLSDYCKDNSLVSFGGDNYINFVDGVCLSSPQPMGVEV